MSGCQDTNVNGKNAATNSCSLCHLQKQINHISFALQNIINTSLKYNSEMNEISKRVDELESKLIAQKIGFPSTMNLPHKCPVCDGNGNKWTTYFKDCKSCQGTGIVWG